MMIAVWIFTYFALWKGITSSRKVKNFLVQSDFGKKLSSPHRFLDDLCLRYFTLCAFIDSIIPRRDSPRSRRWHNVLLEAEYEQVGHDQSESERV